MRRFCISGINTYETDWNRKGHGKPLSEAQAMDRVCRHNKQPGCLTKGLPQPKPEKMAIGLLTDEEILRMAEQILERTNPIVSDDVL
jgi:hypothetical protein